MHGLRMLSDGRDQRRLWRCSVWRPRRSPPSPARTGRSSSRAGRGPMSESCTDDIWSMQPGWVRSRTRSPTPRECETGPAVAPNGGLIAFAPRHRPDADVAVLARVLRPGRPRCTSANRRSARPIASGRAGSHGRPNGKSFVYETINGLHVAQVAERAGPERSRSLLPARSTRRGMPPFRRAATSMATTYRNVSGAAEWFDIWSWDIAAFTGTPLTSGTDNEYAATWSPDGSRLAFARAQHTGTTPGWLLRPRAGGHLRDGRRRLERAAGHERGRERRLPRVVAGRDEDRVRAVLLHRRDHRAVHRRPGRHATRPG